MSEKGAFKLAFHIFVLIVLILSLAGLVIMEASLLHQVTIQYSENDIKQDYNVTGFGVVS